MRILLLTILLTLSSLNAQEITDALTIEDTFLVEGTVQFSSGSINGSFLNGDVAGNAIWKVITESDVSDLQDYALSTELTAVSASVAANLVLINQNTTDINTVSGVATNNLSLINTNITDISNNAGDIVTVSGAVSSNLVLINQNTTDINTVSGTFNSHSLDPNAHHTPTVADYSDGGDSKGFNRLLGTNDNFTQSIETNNIERLVIGTDGSMTLKHPTVPDSDIIFSTNNGFGGFGISKTGASGFMNYMPNSEIPQVIAGSPVATTGTNIWYMDTDNAGTMALQVLPGAGRGGDLIATHAGVLRANQDGTSDLGSSSFYWNNLFTNGVNLGGTAAGILKIDGSGDVFSETENTGFNKNFGTIAGTIAEGDDSRFHTPTIIPTHTGEVTGNTLLTVDPTAISNKTLKTTLVGTESVLILDGTLKKTTAQDIADLGLGMIVQKDDIIIGTTTSTLNFEGDGVSTVIDDGGNKTTVNIPGSLSHTLLFNYAGATGGKWLYYEHGDVLGQDSSVTPGMLSFDYGIKSIQFNNKKVDADVIVAIYKNLDLITPIFTWTLPVNSLWAIKNSGLSGIVINQFDTISIFVSTQGGGNNADDTHVEIHGSYINMNTNDDSGSTF